MLQTINNYRNCGSRGGGGREREEINTELHIHSRGGTIVGAFDFSLIRILENNRDFNLFSNFNPIVENERSIPQNFSATRLIDKE